jgi:L-arabinose isomerase
MSGDEKLRLRAGLLPLYMDMIDKTSPQARPVFKDFIGSVKSKLESLDIEIVVSDISCLQKDFSNAVDLFEKQDVDAIITLHLTYSPSLESAPVLAKTKIPLILLDTTQSFDFGPDKELGDVLFNHAIHGVQDFCNILRRNKKKFFIEAGHWEKTDVLDRVKGRLLQSRMVKSFSAIKAGLLDEPLNGMGDFQAGHELLKKSFGFNIVKADGRIIIESMPGISEEDIKREIELDKTRFSFDDIDKTLYKETIRTSLSLRKWIEDNGLDSFSMNVFKLFEQGIYSVPFLEASKQLAAGTGYAGEGDILTASLTHAIMKAYPETTFTEMFCPDWKNNSIFISHIGEGNYNLVTGKPGIISKKYALIDFRDVIVAVGLLKPGNACLVNIAPGPDDTFSMIAIKGEMLEIKDKDNLNATIHGWFKPERNIDEVLAEYSKLGGTHHKILVYGDVLESIKGFGEMMGLEVNVV